MNHKKEYDGKASAIITDAYIFPNFKPGELPDSKVYNNVEVLGSELGDYSILFGMDIITRTDFLIINKDGKTTFQFRTPSEGGVEL